MAPVVVVPFGSLNASRSSNRIPVGAAEEEEAEEGGELTTFSPGGREAGGRPERDVKMDGVLVLLWLLTGSVHGVHGQGVYGKRVTCARKC